MTVRCVRAVKIKRINSQVTTNGYAIYGQDPGTIAFNELDTNLDTCRLGERFTVLRMAFRNDDVYP